ncbi:MAG: metal-dependent transcriptional regulator, partial [Chloroflexota bacterium]|nr:metal-dependent transcriptional regulator [Chloroflexota bacterium]
DYLKAIYQLATSRSADRSEGPPRVGTVELAHQMHLSPPSVSRMLTRLSSLELVEYEPYRGARLTRHGERAALEVVRHHRLLELYLHDELGYGWDEVHAEADRLEHHISEQLERRIFEALEYPEVDPHGEVIPTVDGAIPSHQEERLATQQALSSVREGNNVVVQEVKSSDSEELRYLEAMGLVPGATAEVLERYPLDGGVRLRLHADGRDAVLGQALADRIMVTGSRAQAPIRDTSEGNGRGR